MSGRYANTVHIIHRMRKENNMGIIELYFKYKFITKILLVGIGITALVIYILMVVKGAKRK